MSRSKSVQSPNHARVAMADRQEAFLAQYELTCHVGMSAEHAGIQRKQHYYWLTHDPSYRPRFEASDKIAIDALEQSLLQRAMHGVEEPVWHQGQQCGSVLKYSDRLGEFLLKGRRPEMYGDRFKTEITGKDGGPIAVVRDTDLASLDEAELLVLAAIKVKLLSGTQ